MIETKEDLKYYLEQDRIALNIPKQTLSRRIIQLFIPLHIWEFEKRMRMIEYYTNKEYSNTISKIIGKILMVYHTIRFRRISVKLGFSIAENTCGPGLSIAHYGSIIINDAAKLGANCRIHNSVNIGASAGVKKAPQIGDNCYIGPGAILFGDIEIANNVTVAANATVNKSCLQENVVLAGTPAKIVKDNMQNWLEFNKVEKQNN